MDPLSSVADPADVARRGARNLAVMTTGRLATHAVLVLTAFIVPRLMGAEVYGRYSAAMAVVQILLAASGAGLPLVEMRFFAPLWRSTDRDAALTLGSTIWISRLALSVAAAFGGFLWFQLSPALGFGFATCGLLALLLLGRAATEATRSLLLSVGKVGAMMTLELLRVGLLLPVVVGGFWLAGLDGVFRAIPLVYAVLLPSAAVVLLSAAPLAARHFRFGALRPHLGYSVSTFFGTVAGIVQTQFAVFAVASWVTNREAGYLAFSVQLFALLQGLFIAARRSLTPLLSELESQGDRDRLAHWGGLMMRYGTAFIGVSAVGWALLGRDVIRLALTESFLPAHAPGTWMLLAVALFCCGGSANGLLYVRGHASRASANLGVYAGVTIAGLALSLLAGGEAGAALRIARVYTLASAVFFGCAVVALASSGGIRLPLGRVLVLLAPIFVAVPATSWEVGGGVRIATFAGFVLAYLGGAVALGLLPLREIRDLAGRLRA